MEISSATEKTFDVIIAGGGLSGALACSRIQRQLPNARILLIEKEPRIGGRLQRFAPESPWSYGLGVVSNELFDFWDQELKTDPESDDLSSFEVTTLQNAGFLVGTKFSDLAIADLCTQKGARSLGGLAASKQWPEVEKILAQENETKEFGDLCSFPRKGPAAIVLETLAGSIGVPDIWSSNIDAITSRMKSQQASRRKGAWAKPLQKLIHSEVEIQTGCLIVNSEYENDLWTIKTEKGTYTTAKLVIAQPPWQAALWLPKKFWPVSLLNLVNKTKPVSVVTLSYKILNPDKLTAPDLTIVPSENVHIIREFKDRVVFQATIDFELSLQAPDVMKAVKALKRAARKLHAACPELKMENEHIALLPVGWSQSPSASERKYFDKLDMDSIQKPHLVFVGDAYGNSYDGDHNIVQSVRTGAEVVTEHGRDH